MPPVSKYFELFGKFRLQMIVIDFLPVCAFGATRERSLKQRYVSCDLLIVFLLSLQLQLTTGALTIIVHPVLEFTFFTVTSIYRAILTFIGFIIARCCFHTKLYQLLDMYKHAQRQRNQLARTSMLYCTTGT